MRKHFAKFARVGIACCLIVGLTAAVSAVASPAAAPLAPPTPAQLSALGASPSSAEAAEPSPLGDLRADQPIISVAFSNGHAVSVSGSATSQQVSLPHGRAARQRAHLAQGIRVTCHVNFTRQRKRALPRGASSARWYGGIGCGRTLLLYGQAFLLQNHKSYWGLGNYYEGIIRSADSGDKSTYVPPESSGKQRSLYIRHLTNAYFTNPLTTGVITITPSKGTTLNKATKCQLGKPVTYGGRTYTEGLHCDLYSERF